MNYDNVKDYRLQKAFKQWAVESGDGFLLRTFISCGHRASSETNGVAILSNGKFSRIFGAKMCGNSWACPICAPVKMAKVASKIGAGIDALQKTHNAIMITFTVFHSKADTCEQTFELLYRTWELTTYPGKKKHNGAYQIFLDNLNIIHKVRCAEVTYSDNGWHPHFHVLFFVPKEHFNEVLDYEERLRAQWRKMQEKAMTEIYGYVKYNAFYESERQHGEGAAGVFISKSDGKPTIQKSSDYLCGWGADKELTGNYLKEATNKNSRTPYQLLKDAYEKNDTEAKELYLTFARYIITHKVRRFDFSRTGLNSIIKQHMNTVGYKELLKKKRTQSQGNAEWRLVAWFTSSGWLNLCYKDKELNFSLITLLLCLAKYDDGYRLINQVLNLHGLEPTLSYDPLGFCQNFVETLNGKQKVENAVA